MPTTLIIIILIMQVIVTAMGLVYMVGTICDSNKIRKTKLKNKEILDTICKKRL